jgi:hypothetical protein
LERGSHESRDGGDEQTCEQPGGQPGRCRRGRGQSRTLGGLSRSNIWTVSMKRTCFVW